MFYKQFGNQEAAIEQFRWVLKGQRPISRVGLSSRRDSTLSLASLASNDSNSNSSSYVYSNPDRFKKYEFVKILKNRCTVATDQIRANAIQPTSILNNNSMAEQPPSPILQHNRKKSGSYSSLLKGMQEQSLLQKQYHQRQSSEIKVGTPTTIENKKSSKNDEGSAMFPSIFTRKHKQRSLSLPQQDISEESSINSKGGSKGKFFGFKFR